MTAHSPPTEHFSLLSWCCTRCEHCVAIIHQHRVCILGLLYRHPATYCFDYFFFFAVFFFFFFVVVAVFFFGFVFTASGFLVVGQTSADAISATMHSVH